MNNVKTSDIRSTKLKSIDINCDLGESINPQQWEEDAHLMPYISSCNIACGGHAGNQESIKVSVANAIHNQLNIGAHPSYPDRKNFGRISLEISEQELRKTLQQQIHSLAAECERQNTSLHHVKPHGALYNDAAANQKLAYIIVEEVKKISPELILVGLAQSAMHQAAKELDVTFWHEGFMDRNYQANGQLVPRSQPQALHKNITESLQQALKLAQKQTIISIEGTPLDLTVDTICLHSDNPDAKAIAQQLYQMLREHQIEIG